MLYFIQLWLEPKDWIRILLNIEWEFEPRFRSKCLSATVFVFRELKNLYIYIYPLV